MGGFVTTEPPVLICSVPFKVVIPAPKSTAAAIVTVGPLAMLSVFALLLVKVFAPPSAIVPVVPTTLRLPAAVPPDSQFPPFPDSVTVLPSMSRLPALMIPSTSPAVAVSVRFDPSTRFPDALSIDSAAIVSPPVFKIVCAAVPFTITVRPFAVNVPASVQLPPTASVPPPAFIASVPLVIVRSPGTVRAAAGIDTVPAPAATVTFFGTPSPTAAPADHSFPTVAPAA